MGTILTLTGPSGSGKSTITQRMLESVPGTRLVPSNTTRSPRENDVPGEYAYLKRSTLMALDRKGKLAWRIEHKGNLYATKNQDLTCAILDPGTIGIMILVPGVLPLLSEALKRLGGSAAWVPVFVRAPHRETLLCRLSHERLIEAERAWPRERLWQQETEALVPSVRIISSEGTVDEAVAKILAFLRE